MYCFVSDFRHTTYKILCSSGRVAQWFSTCLTFVGSYCQIQERSNKCCLNENLTQSVLAVGPQLIDLF